MAFWGRRLTHDGIFLVKATVQSVWPVMLLVELHWGLLHR